MCLPHPVFTVLKTFQADSPCSASPWPPCLKSLSHLLTSLAARILLNHRSDHIPLLFTNFRSKPRPPIQQPVLIALIQPGI